MKILVLSDTHGNIQGFIDKVKGMEKLDLIIHLGDYVEDGLKIEEITGIKTIIVKGNGDYYHFDYNEDEILNIENKRIFITHGHNYDVGYNVYKLLYKAEELNADLILFGHTHMPILFEKDDIIVMNPGSPSIPRGFDRKKTFGIIEIKDNIVGNIIKID